MTLKTFNTKLDGRLYLAAQAYEGGKLITAQQILRDCADSIAMESAGGVTGVAVQAEPEDPWTVTTPDRWTVSDRESCQRGAHRYPETPDGRGWYVCAVCGYTAVLKPGDGSIHP